MNTTDINELPVNPPEPPMPAPTRTISLHPCAESRLEPLAPGDRIEVANLSGRDWHCRLEAGSPPGPRGDGEYARLEAERDAARKECHGLKGRSIRLEILLYASADRLRYLAEDNVEDWATRSLIASIIRELEGQPS